MFPFLSVEASHLSSKDIQTEITNIPFIWEGGVRQDLTT